MRPWPLPLGVACLLALDVAAATPARKEAASKPADGQSAAPSPAPTPLPIRLVANLVIERSWKRRLLATPADHAERISVAGGLLGLGQYQPRGGADYGLKAPPLHLFPGAGAGQSLNVDPNTGRSYFSNTP